MCELFQPFLTEAQNTFLESNSPAILHATPTVCHIYQIEK
jgi:hypothetical protein